MARESLENITITMNEIVEELQAENSSLRFELLVTKKMVQKLRNHIESNEPIVEEVAKEDIEVVRF